MSDIHVHDPDLLGAPRSSNLRGRKMLGAVSEVTGIQPAQYLRAFIESGVVVGLNPILEEQIQPASLDLRLGNLAYRIRASFLPGTEARVMDRVHQMDGYRIEFSDSAVLEAGQVYVIPLQEGLRLPGTVQGFANPKSTTGRLDVLTRLVTDHGAAFDETIAGYEGPMFVEVAPKTFSVVVRPGTRLNQIRFQRNSDVVVPNIKLKARYFAGDLVRPFNQNEKITNSLIPVTIDLIGDPATGIIGFRAKKHTDRIEISQRDYYDARDYWEPIYANKDRTLTLDPSDFYILATIEEVRVPPEYAAEMVAYQPRAGEYRVHYAGFFDPGFGWDSRGGGGSKAVLEVRSLAMPFMLEHGQTVGWIRYDRMTDIPDQVYGPQIGSNYHGQGLALAKQFKPYVPRTR